MSRSSHHHSHSPSLSHSHSHSHSHTLSAHSHTHSQDATRARSQSLKMRKPTPVQPPERPTTAISLTEVTLPPLPSFEALSLPLMLSPPRRALSLPIPPREGRRAGDGAAGHAESNGYEGDAGRTQNPPVYTGTNGRRILELKHEVEAQSLMLEAADPLPVGRDVPRGNVRESRVPASSGTGLGLSLVDFIKAGPAGSDSSTSHGLSSYHDARSHDTNEVDHAYASTHDTHNTHNTHGYDTLDTHDTHASSSPYTAATPSFSSPTPSPPQPAYEPEATYRHTSYTFFPGSSGSGYASGTGSGNGSGKTNGYSNPNGYYGTGSHRRASHVKRHIASVYGEGYGDYIQYHAYGSVSDLGQLQLQPDLAQVPTPTPPQGSMSSSNTFGLHLVREDVRNDSPLPPPRIPVLTHASPGRARVPTPSYQYSRQAPPRVHVRTRSDGDGYMHGNESTFSL